MKLVPLTLSASQATNPPPWQSAAVQLGVENWPPVKETELYPAAPPAPSRATLSMKREFVSTSVPVVINPAPMHAACEQALSWNKLAVAPGRVVGVNPGPVTGRAIVDQPCAAQVTVPLMKARPRCSQPR